MSTDGAIDYDTQEDTVTNNDLDGQIIAVTGGTGAIGGAVIAAVRRSGGTPIHLSRSVDSDDPTHHRLDVSDSAAVDEVFSRIVTDHGRLDGLVHAAGVSNLRETKNRIAPQLNRRFDDEYPVIDGLTATTDEDWRRLIAINLDGAFFCLRAALRHMVPRREGRVVMISSNAGIAAEAGSAAYSASKGGAQLLMQAAALEVVGSGVRVNAVAPGPTLTPLVADSTASGYNFLARIPARRIADPSEIARAVHFLLTDVEGFLVGETINVNGGMMIR